MAGLGVGGLLGVVGQEDERGPAVAEAVDELSGPGDRLPAAVDDRSGRTVAVEGGVRLAGGRLLVE